MSNLQQALTPAVISAASTRQLLEAAHTLLQVAFTHARTDPTGPSHGLSGHDLPGHELSGVELPEHGLLELVAVAQQVQNAAWATQTICLEQLAAHELRKHPESPDTWTPLEVGARLGWSDRQASRRLTEAGDTVRHAARLLDRAGTGAMDGRKVAAIAGVLADAPAHAAGPIEDELLAGDPEISTSTTLTRRARRLLAKHAPVEADQAAAHRRRDYTDVTCEPHWEPGMSTLTAVLPALDATTLMAAINTHARLLKKSTTTDKTLGEHRVDALTDLLLSDVHVNTELVVHVPCHATTIQVVPEPHVPVQVSPDCPITAQDYLDQIADLDTRRRQLTTSSGTDPATGPPDSTAGVAIPDPVTDPNDWIDYQRHYSPEALLDEELETLLATPGLTFTTTTDPRRDEPNDPGEPAQPCTIGDVLVPGIGTIPAGAVRELSGLLGTTVSRALVDSATGITAETGCRSYTPNARLVRFLHTRDQHCRFPGCTRPATATDIDHVVRYPDGPTAAHNLQCLCRHHHRAKHEGGWTVSMTPDGVCTWTSPGGYTYLTRPNDQPPRTGTARSAIS
ncbi:HNH endonuclease signature motif containing protein [Flexivirga meconopsidis]|uniref:HNH endonuclease signature motif containing protein n=1 Tax=Flexivirga meconopsidis TaxID=2977121 RepID=UPI0022400C91|nr:HNH endonuclease signature motif containing protein [Flexivirga meconopsidis]